MSRTGMTLAALELAPMRHHAVVQDGVAGDLRGAVGVGLAVVDLGGDLVLLAVAADDAVFPGVLVEPVELPLAGRAEGGHGAGHGDDVAGLDLAALFGVGGTEVVVSPRPRVVSAPAVVVSRRSGGRGLFVAAAGRQEAAQAARRRRSPRPATPAIFRKSRRLTVLAVLLAIVFH